MRESARLAPSAPDGVPVPPMPATTTGDDLMNADRDRSEQPRRKRAEGGAVHGPGSSDNVAAWLSPGCVFPSLPRGVRPLGLGVGSESLADAGTTQSAPEPSQTATEAHSDDERVRKYAEAIMGGKERAALLVTHNPGESANAYRDARAVVAMADTEQAELRATVARVEALADEWWGRATEAEAGRPSWRSATRALRAALEGDQ